MRILVIGGTYFLGKAFVDLAVKNDHEILMLNRGTRDYAGRWGGKVRFFQADRHDKESLQRLSELLLENPVDAVVDFCAYESGDIQGIMDSLPKGVRQYVFLSTCDVYRRGTGEALGEDAPLEDRMFGGQEGAYICGKVALEKELAVCTAKKGVHYTSLRPVIIYGPGNYAPREGIFFHWIANAGQILLPDDADGYFQMVYVQDVAKCIDACLLREDCYDTAINICDDEVFDYQVFAEGLEKACGGFERISIPIGDILDRGLALPFAMMREESERYRSDAVKKLGVAFTPLEKGLRETYEAFLLTQGQE